MTLMEHKRDTDNIGDVRKKQSFMGKYIVNVSGMENYNPPTPEEIDSYMADIQRFIKRDDVTMGQNFSWDAYCYSG
jgi:hypothetical protein